MANEISTKIVKDNTTEILKELAPQLGVMGSKMVEIAPQITSEILKYKHIDKLAVIEASRAVAPYLPSLGEKLYESLALCSEEERGKVLKFGFATTAVGILGTAAVVKGADIIKCAAIQSGRTKRTGMICEVLNNFSLGGIIGAMKGK